MNYIKQFFQPANNDISKYSVDNTNRCGVASPIETAICPTPNESRRIIKTIDGLELVLSSDDIRHIELLQNMFDNLKSFDSSGQQVPYIVVPVSINSLTMQLVIKWRKLIKNGQLVLSEFFEPLSIDQIIQLINASLFLETKVLGEESAKWIASKLEGKTTPEMARILQKDRYGLSKEHKEKLATYRKVIMPDNDQFIVNQY